MKQDVEKDEKTVIKEMLSINKERNAVLDQGYDPGEETDTPDGFDRRRMLEDFPYWAAKYARISRKGGGPETTLKLNPPQRKLVGMFESMRRAGEPIRVILLKARQWGGSTCVQLYMAWLQLLHRTGLNSLIIAHQGMATDEIKRMLERLIDGYPAELLTDADGNPVEGKRLVSAGRSGGTYGLKGRGCTVKLGSAERPDACRGGDYALVHCSEVGMWRRTPGKTPEDIVRSATSGVLYRPYTMIVLESTANGTGTFFHREYLAAKEGESQFKALFIPWFDIPAYRLALADAEDFARELYTKRNETIAGSTRTQPGSYLWWLWERGASLEAINWYVAERRKYSDHSQMASEYPSDDVEAFANSGTAVFDRREVERMRSATELPFERGELQAKGRAGREALENLHFSPTEAGLLKVWRRPETQRPPNYCLYRYLVVVDVGGRSARSDWSVIAVIDRWPMTTGSPPEIVAQWRGHCDMDLLAWKAAQIASFYDDALLVIESNTLETHDTDRAVDGDQSLYILDQVRNVYRNLYSRKRTPDEIKGGAPARYGFHTNTATKPMVVASLVRCIRDGLYVERDPGCLEEFLQYEQKQNGSYGAVIGAHDDMLMTRAIGLYICFSEREMPRPRMINRGIEAHKDVHYHY